MYEDKKFLAVLPARGGSKGLPRKNVLPLAGKPMIAWSIEAAQQSRYIDRLVVSTDDDEICDAAIAAGAEVPFMRPKELGQDDTSVYDVLFHVLDALEESYDYIVLLQCTSPLRTVADIDGCIEFCMQIGAPSCAAVVEPAKSPYWMFNLEADHKMVPLLPQEKIPYRRQDLPITYAISGLMYVSSIPWFRETKSMLAEGTIGYPTSNENTIDVDSAIDFKLAEIKLEERLHDTANQ